MRTEFLIFMGNIHGMILIRLLCSHRNLIFLLLDGAGQCVGFAGGVREEGRQTGQGS